jgi:hypothetical protein
MSPAIRYREAGRELLRRRRGSGCGRPRSYGSEIVEDDDVAFFEGWDESLLDIGDEALAIDGAVDNEWRIDPIAPQRRDEGQRLPAPIGKLLTRACGL